LHSLSENDSDLFVVNILIAFMQFTLEFVLPTDTPEERVKILKDAFRKSWNDREFHDNWKKLTGADASPLMPEQLEELVRTIPRDPEAVKLYNTLAGADALPAR
jgi:tripartite-type tricarboxylate transporter receptor subunit TctC